MGTIHNKGVLVGGLIAGAVLSMSDVLLYGSVLKAPMEAAWRAAGRPTMTDLQRTLEVPASIFLDFVVGIVLMWLYAAIQPPLPRRPRDRRASRTSRLAPGRIALRGIHVSRVDAARHHEHYDTRPADGVSTRRGPRRQTLHGRRRYGSAF